VAIKLMWGVDGVVDIIDHLGVEQLSGIAAQASQQIPQQPSELQQ
jgi:hypothetical protein